VGPRREWKEWGSYKAGQEESEGRRCDLVGARKETRGLEKRRTGTEASGGPEERPRPGSVS